LILLAISLPVVVVAATLGIEPTKPGVETPSPPELLEEVVAEEPVVEESPPAAEPEVVTIEAPPVAVEDPVVAIEEPVAPEPEPVRTQAFIPPGPATPDGWIVQLIAASGVSDYLIVESFKNVYGDWVVVGEWVPPGGEIPPEAYDPGLIIDIKVPTETPYIGDNLIPYRLFIKTINGGIQTLLINEPIPLEWIYAPADIQVTVDIVDPYTVPGITIANVGELPLTITNIVVDSGNNEMDATLAALESTTVADLGVVLPASVGLHLVTIYSSDADEPEVVVPYVILAPPVEEPSMEVVAADMAAGFGSERFGVTVAVDLGTAESVEVSVVVETMADPDALLSEVATVVVAASGEVFIPVKVLFGEASGALYQYRVTMVAGGEVVAEEVVENVGLYFWSTFRSIAAKKDFWQVKVTWDNPLPAGDFVVYACLRYWDAATGVLYEVTDSAGNQVIDSANIKACDDGDEPRVQAVLKLMKPDTYVKVATSYDLTPWMGEYGSGYFFFTYMAWSGAVDPWAERIGCPPEAL